jgi:hypothetical protein
MVFEQSPHPDYPVGAAVRVKPTGRAARTSKARLVGRIGTVVRSTARELLVEFPGEKFKEHFLPGQVEPAPDPAG